MGEFREFFCLVSQSTPPLPLPALPPTPLSPPPLFLVCLRYSSEAG